MRTHEEPTEGQWLVAGLGNPGTEYANTRHNVGHMVIKELARRTSTTLKAHRSRTHTATAHLGIKPGGIPGPKVTLAISDSYMNTSGLPLSKLANFLSIPAQRILVIHDDLDLPAHQLRLKFSGGEGGHNGMKSLTEHMGTRDYYRVRIGVGRPPGRMNPADWVLAQIRSQELAEWEVTIAQAADAVEDIVTQGFSDTQQRVHSSAD